ncbi:MAG: hypothetical protein Q8O95_05135 [bacterium]|nr:hypothetical protein [bacterium]
MSTLKKNITAQRIRLLAANGEMIFHTGDLANLWEIGNANTLRTTLARYVCEGLIHRIYRGMYSLVPVHRLDPYLLGAKALHQYCYLSTETVLFEEGVINQAPQYMTFIASDSRRFAIAGHQYFCRQMNPRYLYQVEEIRFEKGYFRASVERAIADQLYYNPRAHFDRSPDWSRIRMLQETLRYPLTPSRYADSPTP